MSNLEKAIEIEKQLRSEHKFFYGTFIPKIQELGFKTMDEYLELKKDYLFKNWKPDVIYLDALDVASQVKEAIQSNKDCIFICKGEGIHAFHGGDELDYELCDELGIKIVELNTNKEYSGGTIIGSKEDFSMLIISPKMMMLEKEIICEKLIRIINKYIPQAVFSENDILIDGKKVAGTGGWNNFEKINVFSVQVSFKDYSDYISQICTKPAIKEPGYIISTVLTRDLLEKEILAWLRNEEIEEGLVNE